MKLRTIQELFLIWLTSLLMAGSVLAGGDMFSSEFKGNVTISGTVKYMKIEGGFWGFIGDDGRYYEPDIPEKYRQEGLHLKLHGKFRDDIGSITMTGPIIEVDSIEEIKPHVKNKYQLLNSEPYWSGPMENPGEDRSRRVRKAP